MGAFTFSLFGWRGQFHLLPPREGKMSASWKWLYLAWLALNRKRHIALNTTILRRLRSRPCGVLPWRVRSTRHLASESYVYKRELFLELSDTNSCSVQFRAFFNLHGSHDQNEAAGLPRSHTCCCHAGHLDCQSAVLWQRMSSGNCVNLSIE